MLSAMSMHELCTALHGSNVATTYLLTEEGASYFGHAAHSDACETGDRASSVEGTGDFENVCGRPASVEDLIRLLLAKWQARTGMQALLEEAARAQLTNKMPAEEVEVLIEKQIATEQTTYLVEFFWLLEATGCAAPERMQAWIDRHNALTTQMWVDVLLEKVIKTAKLLLVDGHRLQNQQENLIAELLRSIEKVRLRMVRGPRDREVPSEYLQRLDSASRILRELAASKRVDPSPDPPVRVLVTELEASRRLRAPRGPRHKRRLERLLDEAYFGAQTRYACSFRLDGSRVVLSSSDLERFMAIHMDPRLCRERLEGLVKAGLFEDDLFSDGRGPTVRLFRLTQEVGVAVAAGLEPLRARLDARNAGSVPRGPDFLLSRTPC